jgi:hypothetical protein
MHDLACLLIPQEIWPINGHQGPQSPEITDTRLLSVVLCEIPFLFNNNGLRDLRAKLIIYPG